MTNQSASKKDSFHFFQTTKKEENGGTFTILCANNAANNL